MFFFWQSSKGHARFAAGVFQLVCTTWALHHQDIASGVDTIGQVVIGFAAVVALRNHVFADPFSHALIEHKIDAFEVVI